MNVESTLQKHAAFNDKSAIKIYERLHNFYNGIYGSHKQRHIARNNFGIC